MESISSQNCRRDNGSTPGGRFVKDQQIRVMNQRTAQAQFLFHAAGEFPRRPIQKRMKASRFRQFIDAPVAFLEILTEQPGEKVDVFPYGKGWIQVLAQTLRHVGDTREKGIADFGIGNILVKDFDMAFLDLLGTGNERQQG